MSTMCNTKTRRQAAYVVQFYVVEQSSYLEPISILWDFCSNVLTSAIDFSQKKNPEL